jgi:DeoR/GlpR family transcriptional regulator of sugar metabolism
MLPEQRFSVLVEILQENQIGHLADLAHRLGVSVNTVRRDLQQLEEQGLVRRIRGGALYTKQVDVEAPLDVRWREHTQEKKLIAVAAAELIEADEIALLDTGSTNLYLAKELRGKKRVTVVTCSLPVMWELRDDSQINLVGLGGELYRQEKYFHGPQVDQELAQLRVDKLFLGIASIEAEHGLSELHLAEIPLKRAMMEAAHERIVLADGSKVGYSSFFRLCAVSDVDMLITDRSADPAEIAKLEQTGLKVLVASGEAPDGTGAGLPAA